MSKEDKLTLTILPEQYAVYRMSTAQEVPLKLLEQNSFVSITRTEEELSVVCAKNLLQKSKIPEGAAVTEGMRVLKVEGPLSFSSVGILLSLLEPLAENRISVMAVSTYDTDYILVRDEDLCRATAVLEKVCALRGGL
jgi:hypothetical protein